MWDSIGLDFAAEILSVYTKNLGPENNSSVVPLEIGGFDVGKYMYIYDIGFAGVMYGHGEAKREALEQINSVIKYVNANSNLWSGKSISTTTRQGSYYKSLDLLLAIHGHYTWHKAEKIKCVNGKMKATFTIYIDDICDFKKGYADIHANMFGYVTPTQLLYMHNWGLFRAYFIYGEAQADVEWIVGTSTPSSLVWTRQ